MVDRGSNYESPRSKDVCLNSETHTASPRRAEAIASLEPLMKLRFQTPFLMLFDE
jgi:hypothetical protein